MTTFPTGYGTATVSLENLQNRHIFGMEPEYARRLFTWLASQNGKFGIGSGWRPTPSDISQASREGKSFHQTQKFRDGYSGYAAVDLVVVSPGGLHRAPTRSEAIWQGSALSKQIGLHMNVDSETWHIQPIEIDGWQTWVDAGRRRPVPNYPISGAPVNPPVPPVPPAWPPFAPEFGQFSLWPLNTAKPGVFLGMPGQPLDAIRYLQGVLSVRAKIVLACDGFYGQRTANAVGQFQGWNNLKQDEWVGPQTWAAIDKLALR